ncbi:MAG: WecB/TagA/CpsF family glycosyltransferase [Elusimicrobiota bacterium]
MRVKVLGFDIDALASAAALAAVDGFLNETPRRPRQIITANALMILAAETHAGLRDAFRRADLVLPDSVGVCLAARLSGRPLPETVPGVDFLESLCRRAAGSGLRVFLLGAAPGVSEAAAGNLRVRHPGLRIAGTRHGYFSPEEENDVFGQISAAAPDFVFVALDVPRQDAWICENLSRFGSAVVMGVGGSFDVLSGRLARAPRWMRAAKLEWLFRVLQEPSRAARMARLPAFLWKALTDRRSAAFLLAGVLFAACRPGSSPSEDAEPAGVQARKILEASKQDARSLKDEYAARAEARLSQLESALNELKTKSAAGGRKTRKAAADRLDALQGKRAGAQKRLQAIRSAGETGWEKLRSGLDEALTDFQESLDKVTVLQTMTCSSEQPNIFCKGSLHCLRF